MAVGAPAVAPARGGLGAAKPPAATVLSPAGSRCGGLLGRCGERRLFPVGLAGGQAVKQAPEEAVVEVAQGGGVALALVFAPVVMA